MKKQFINRLLPLLITAMTITMVMAETSSIPLTLTPVNSQEALTLPAQINVQLPGAIDYEFKTPDSNEWLAAASVKLELFWSQEPPEKTEILFWLKDRNAYWHQYLLPMPLESGITNLIEIPFHSSASGWSVPGHSATWHHRVRINPESTGFRIFANNTTFTGACTVVSAVLEQKICQTPPTIKNIRSLTRQPQVLECYELRFDLPDRYTNPFDPSEIDAGALIVTPDNTTNSIHAFYYQPYYRLEDELDKPVEPYNYPEWRIRYCPRTTGEHQITLYARDKFGETTSTNVITFTAAAESEDAQRFVRVSQKDTRYFELCNGEFFYPLGHNVRSAIDKRMDDKFPWIFRHDEGTTAYRRFFKRMQAAGENMAEIWMSAWSMGLEWSAGVSGYHGANDYHLGNAWELDKVMNLARQHGIHVNLVLNYHGRISNWCDPEWHLHPYNKNTPGGWLEMPFDFFTDKRAIEMQKRFCRYTHARWGWSPAILGYELCSEIDLVGNKSQHRAHHDPAVVAWCQEMGGYFKEIDFYGHLVSTHFSTDYKHINPEICKLPEMDINALDAYHYSRAERIITLIQETATKGSEFNRPMLITEFGGSAMAANLEHLQIELHAALWSGVCTPICAAPMFWWWQVIDENNLYPRFTAVKKFITNMDLREPAAQLVKPQLMQKNKEGNTTELKNYGVVCTASPKRTRGYIYPRHFPRAGQNTPLMQKVVLLLPDIPAGVFRIEFYDTESGELYRSFDQRSENNQLSINVPDFTRDTAFKTWHLTSPAPTNK